MREQEIADEDFDSIVYARMTDDSEQTWWEWEWGGFRNMLGFAVILRQWRGDRYPRTFSETTGAA